MCPSDCFQQRQVFVRHWCAIAFDNEAHLDAAPLNFHWDNARDQEMGCAFRRLPVARWHGQLERQADT